MRHKEEQGTEKKRKRPEQLGALEASGFQGFLEEGDEHLDQMLYEVKFKIENF